MVWIVSSFEARDDVSKLDLAAIARQRQSAS
jgi:hypothetical protein